MRNYYQEPSDFNIHAKNWKESVGEMSDFFGKNLNNPNFLIFLRDQGIFQKEIPFESEMENSDDGNHQKDERERWAERLEDLLDKATKRLGYGVKSRKDELMSAAVQEISRRRNDFELPASKTLDYFCGDGEKNSERV